MYFIIKVVITVLLSVVGQTKCYRHRTPSIFTSSASKFSIKKIICTKYAHSNSNAAFISSSLFLQKTRIIQKSFKSISSSAPVASLLSLGCRLFNPSFTGGVLAGGLHAITGPDHLVALLPNTVGKSSMNGVKVGAMWGLGHGLSAILLGVSAFFLKGKVSGRFAFVKKLSNLAESAVGLSLIAIGIVGIRESLADDSDHHSHIESGSSVASPNNSKSSNLGAVFTNGIIHGFSWDGAPSIAPAIAMSTWNSVMTFLLSYCLGTMIAMSITAGAIGDFSLRLSKVSNIDNLPKKLSMISSVIAILIGIIWTAQSFLHFL
eukprot:gene5598-7727_t